MSIGSNVARESDALHLVSYDFGHSGTCGWEGMDNQENFRPGVSASEIRL